MHDLTTISFKLHADELELLDELVRFERLKRTDVLRRAIRSYAEKLGVLTPPKKSRK